MRERRRPLQHRGLLRRVHDRQADGLFDLPRAASHPHPRPQDSDEHAVNALDVGPQKIQLAHDVLQSVLGEKKGPLSKRAACA